MKQILYSSLFIVALISLALAADCPYNSGEATLEYSNCKLIKPVETYVGESVIVNCTNHEKVNNQWILSPLAKTRLTITGYDKDDVALHGEVATTKKDGTYTFIPRIAGRYLIQVSSCDYDAWFDVEENPVVDTGIVTPTGAAVAEPEPEPVEEPEVEPIEEPEVEETGSLLDLVVDGTESSKANEEASGLFVILVSLLI